jgi:predicted nicotinamide N-methyase
MEAARELFSQGRVTEAASAFVGVAMQGVREWQCGRDEAAEQAHTAWANAAACFLATRHDDLALRATDAAQSWFSLIRSPSARVWRVQCKALARQARAELALGDCPRAARAASEAMQVAEARVPDMADQIRIIVREIPLSETPGEGPALADEGVSTPWQSSRLRLVLASALPVNGIRGLVAEGDLGRALGSRHLGLEIGCALGLEGGEDLQPSLWSVKLRLVNEFGLWNTRAEHPSRRLLVSAFVAGTRDVVEAVVLGTAVFDSDGAVRVDVGVRSTEPNIGLLFHTDCATTLPLLVTLEEREARVHRVVPLAPGWDEDPMDRSKSLLFVEGSGGDIEGKVWDAGVAVAEWIAASKGLLVTGEGATSSLEGQVVVDVGAGTGIAGLAVAATCAPRRVFLTDLPVAVGLMRENAAVNGFPSGTVTAAPLAWGDAAAWDRLGVGEAAPILLLADVVYDPEGYKPLLATLQAARAQWPEMRAILAYRHRRPEAVEFFDSLAADFAWSLVSGPAVLDHWRQPSAEISVYIIRPAISG